MIEGKEWLRRKPEEWGRGRRRRRRGVRCRGQG